MSDTNGTKKVSSTNAQVTQAIYNATLGWKTVQEIRDSLLSQGITVNDVPRAIRRMRGAGHKVEVRIIPGSSPRAFEYRSL